MQQKIYFICSKMFRPGDCDNGLEPEHRLAPNRVRIPDSSTLRRMPICTGSKADPLKSADKSKTQKNRNRNVLHLQCKGFLRHLMFPMVFLKKVGGRYPPTPTFGHMSRYPLTGCFPAEPLSVSQNALSYQHILKRQGE